MIQLMVIYMKQVPVTAVPETAVIATKDRSPIREGSPWR